VRKKDAERTINIEVREKNTEVKVLKTQLKSRQMNDAERSELNTRITILLTVIDEQKKLLKISKEQRKSLEEKVASSRKLLDTLKAERDSAESSLVADIELLLKIFAIKHAAYYGGDCNGVFCRRLVGNAAEIVEQLRAITKSKKDDSCEDSEI
jgi:hypothetical protein